jgi:spore maturation protein CgeD
VTKVSVFLPSYNKGAYVLDAMRSVLNQTHHDWQLYILENSNDGETHKIVEAELARWDELEDQYVGDVRYERLQGDEIERQRREKYITAWLLNVYYPEARGEYIFYLSDDDLIDPECFEVMAGEMDSNPSYYAVYAGMRWGTPTGPGDCGPFPNVGIPALDAKSFPGSMDQRVDGGQVMHRKICLDSLVPPYFEESREGRMARHCDGLFLERLVGRFVFWPIDRYLITHRWTSESLWSPVQPGRYQS